MSLQLCIPFPLIDLLTGGSILMLGAFLLAHRKSRQEDEQIDGNERLMIQLSILAAFTVLVFIIFIFAWRPC
jgi:hypothetical protein